MSSPSTPGQLFGQEIRCRLSEGHKKIRHCVDQLSDQQLWWRPQESMNSVANIILHLCGNIRQWMIDGITGAPDHRNRPLEFQDRSMLPRKELLARLDLTVAEADRVLSHLADSQFMEPRRIQGFDETVMSAILNSVTHFVGHSQEIIYITRLQLGASYRFAWAPATPEQGAS